MAPMCLVVVALGVMGRPWSVPRFCVPLSAMVVVLMVAAVCWSHRFDYALTKRA